MNLNKSWSYVIATTAGIYIISLIVGVTIYAVTPHAGMSERSVLPEGYMHRISGLKTITVEDAYSDFTNNSAVFIDARDGAEYKEGHIKGAINIPYDKFKQYYPHYKKLLTNDKTIITYCHGVGCGLSIDVAKDLIALGYTNIYVMTAGWPGWISADLPVSVEKEP